MVEERLREEREKRQSRSGRNMEIKDYRKMRKKMRRGYYSYEDVKYINVHKISQNMLSK